LVKLSVNFAAGKLHAAISDTGAGFPSANGSKAGVGLENVTRRLQLCYGHEAKIAIDSGADGTTVSFSIPASYAGSAAHVMEVSG
jgi:LytS/YehU family sensor histidine kinase